MRPPSRNPAVVLDVSGSMNAKLGDTILIHSIPQAVDDLTKAGVSTVILIADGEESCKGDSKAAATQITDSGVHVTLNIVGFTNRIRIDPLGQTLEEQLTIVPDKTTSLEVAGDRFVLRH